MLLYPGQTGPLVALQDCVREIHEARREGVLKLIAKRARGKPGPDPMAVPDQIKGLARACVEHAEAGAFDDARTAASSLLAAIAPPLEDPGEYEPNDALEGVSVRFRKLSAKRSRELRLALDTQNGETLRAPDGAAMRASDDKAVAIIATYITEAVAEIVYDDGAGHEVTVAQVGGDDVDALQANGIFASVFQCAVKFQELPAKKAFAFGRSPLSTSQSASTATPVGLDSKRLEDATADESGRTSSEPITKTTPAQRSDSSRTPTSSPPSISPALSESTSGSMGPSG